MAFYVLILQMMKHLKFIITNSGHLRLGEVTLHRELLMPHELCLGGGFYEFDYASNVLILSGKSFDYGAPRWNRIDVLQVPESYRGVPIVYRDQWDEEISITDTFTIKYY